ncbi:RNA polymerase sigma factor [Mycolicibacterium goodii]|uniref:RNA polymerase sigma factor n=1 Tax=Mycolicibacterium goodii TaxID=134601 RepID=UPI0027DF1F9A|nr:RNA polymerase sigma factor [Mycolicibacterium goodii]
MSDISAWDRSSAEWLVSLRARRGQAYHGAVAELHAMLLKIARHELNRRNAPPVGVEFDDMAHHAAADALLAILAKLGTYRGESRFTTWVYKFVVFEVLNKLKRWRVHRRVLAAEIHDEQWEVLAERFATEPSHHVEARDAIAAVRRAIWVVLTERQRQLFIGAVINGDPLDALAARLGISRNAVYKGVFDARRKIREFLVANGHLVAGPSR